MTLPNPDPDLYIAAQIISSEQKASISLLQRRLRVTYKIASEIMQQLQEIGIIEKSDETYKILVNEDDLFLYFSNLEEKYNIKIPVAGRIFEV